MKLKITALILAMLMLAATLASCGGDDTTDTDTGTDTQASTDTSAEGEGGEENADAVTITVADAKATAGVTGDVKAAFAEESGEENVITAPAQNAVAYSLYASFSAPTKITSLVLTAPSKDQSKMASATIDGSVDGKTWVNLKTLGSSITKGKTYTLAVNDETAYLYIRVRQADEHRTEEFRFRNVVIKGVPQSGEGGNIANVVEETDTSTLIAMTNYVTSNSGTGDVADVFRDNTNTWTAGASIEGAPNYVIATMVKKTEIRRVTVKLWDSNRQPRGTEVQASENGQTWVTLYTIEDLKNGDVTAETGEWTFYVNDATQYSFIRLVQREDLATYAWTLQTVLIYGIESEEAAAELPVKFVAATTLGVTHSIKYTNVDPHTAADVLDVSAVWDLSDKTTEWTNKAHDGGTDKYYIGGSFAYGTVITQIKYYCPPKYAERVRTSYFEASVDGETWVKIAQLPGQSASNPIYLPDAVFTLNIDDDTQYKYIRLVHGDGFEPYYWTIGTIEVIGVQYDADGNLIQTAPSTPTPTPDPEPSTPAVVGTTQAVTLHESTAVRNGSNAANFFDVNATSSTTFDPDAQELDYIAGKFETATRITKIIYTCLSDNWAGRARDSYFEASVDGTTWVKLNATIANAAGVQTFEITDTTEYNYIRIHQWDEQPATEYWSVGKVEVQGVAATTNA